MVTQQTRTAWTQPGTDRTLVAVGDKCLNIYPFLVDLPTARDLRQALDEAIPKLEAQVAPQPAAEAPSATAPAAQN